MKKPTPLSTFLLKTNVFHRKIAKEPFEQGISKFTHNNFNCAISNFDSIIEIESKISMACYCYYTASAKIYFRGPPHGAFASLTIAVIFQLLTKKYISKAEINATSYIHY